MVLPGTPSHDMTLAPVASSKEDMRGCSTMAESNSAEDAAVDDGMLLLLLLPACCPMLDGPWMLLTNPCWMVGNSNCVWVSALKQCKFMKVIFLHTLVRSG